MGGQSIVNQIRKYLHAFARGVSGATVIEYALIAGIICLAVVSGATTLGQSTNGSFNSVDEKVWGDS